MFVEIIIKRVGQVDEVLLTEFFSLIFLEEVVFQKGFELFNRDIVAVLLVDLDLFKDVTVDILYDFE